MSSSIFDLYGQQLEQSPESEMADALTGVEIDPADIILEQKTKMPMAPMEEGQATQPMAESSNGPLTYKLADLLRVRAIEREKASMKLQTK